MGWTAARMGSEVVEGGEVGGVLFRGEEEDEEECEREGERLGVCRNVELGDGGV